MTKTAVATEEPLILQVGDEQIVIDEKLVGSLADVSSYTEEELAFLSRQLGSGWMKDGEPTAGMVATMLTTRVARDRDWDPETIEQVIIIFLAWLTDRLVEF